MVATVPKTTSHILPVIMLIRMVPEAERQSVPHTGDTESKLKVLIVMRKMVFLQRPEICWELSVV